MLTGAASVLVLGLVGLAYGLWQKVQFLNWQNAHPGQTRNLGTGILGWSDELAWILFLALCSVGAAARMMDWKQRGETPRRGQLLAFSAIGAGQLAFGLYCAFSVIRRFVWSANATWYSLLGMSTYTALPFCWVGIFLIWQSVWTYQAVVSGTGAINEEQTAQLNNRATFLTLAIELAVFGALSFVVVPTGTFQPPSGHGKQGDFDTELRFWFIVTAVVSAFLPLLTVSVKFARGVGRGVASFTAVIFAGGLLKLLSVLPKTLYAQALLIGLLGGVVLLKAANPRKPSAGQRAQKIGEGTLRINVTGFFLAVAGEALAAIFLAKALPPPQRIFLAPAFLSATPAVLYFLAKAATGQLRRWLFGLTVFLTLNVVALLLKGVFLLKYLPAVGTLFAVVAGQLAALVVIKFARMKMEDSV